jgi:hypothetical protein
MAWVVDTLKVSPEHASLPDALVDATPQQLAEARSRLQEISQVATELQKIVDAELAIHLQGGAMRYGDQIFRPNGRGAPKVTNADMWWPFVTRTLFHVDKSMRPIVMDALYPASAVRLTGLKILATAAETDEQTIKETFIHYDPPTSPLSVIPISKAPKWAQKLEEGQLSNRRVGE